MRRAPGSESEQAAVARRPSWLARAALIGVVLGALVTLTVVAFRAAADSRALAARAEAIQASGQRVLVDMLSVQNGAGGFVITGDPAFLTPYRQGVAVISSDVQHLAVLTRPYGRFFEHVAALRFLIAVTRGAVAKIVALEQSGHRGAAVRAVSQRLGTPAVGMIRGQIEAVEAEAESLPGAARRDADRALGFALIAGGALLAFALALAAGECPGAARVALPRPV